MLDVNAIKTPEDFVRVVFDELTTLQDLNYIDDIEKYEEEIKTFENQLKNARLSLINENYTHKIIAESLYHNDQYYKTPQGNEDRAYDYYLLCEINWQLSLFCHKYYPSEVFEKDNTLNKCYYFVSNIELYKQGKFTDPMVALFAGYELLKFLYDSRCYVHAIEYLKDIDELLPSRQFKQSDITKPKTNELISTMTTYYSKLKTEFKNSRNEYTNIMEPYIDSGLAILQTKRIY